MAAGASHPFARETRVERRGELVPTRMHHRSLSQGRTEQRQGVLRLAADAALLGDDRLGPAGVGHGAPTLAVGHQQRVARGEHGGRIPAHRNAPGEQVVAARGGDVAGLGKQVEDGYSVGIGLGDEEPGLVGRERQRVWRAPLLRARGRRIEQLRHDVAPASVDHGDPIGARAGDEQPGAVVIEEQRRGMAADHDATTVRHGTGGVTEHTHRRAAQFET